jgi:hypothetical protein
MSPAARKTGTNVATVRTVTSETSELVPASKGVGPLLQRDYWAVLADYDDKPSALMSYIRQHFCEFPPGEIVHFTAGRGIVLGADIDIAIAPAQQCCVRVVHHDAQSFTLGTLTGHPEAGRITFGAYRNPLGEVILHIRSRARSSRLPERIGFMAIGDAMQTNTWTDFIVNVAARVGARIEGVIHADTEEVEPLPADDDPLDSPTYLAVGD